MSAELIRRLLRELRDAGHPHGLDFNVLTLAEIEAEFEDDPKPVPFDRTKVKLDDYVRTNQRLEGGDNNGEDSTVPAGEIWKIEHLNQAGPGSFTAVHPSGVVAAYDQYDTDEQLSKIENVTGQVFSCNVRAMSMLTATRYIEAADEDQAEAIVMKAANHPHFVWERSEPCDIEFESMD